MSWFYDSLGPPVIGLIESDRHLRRIFVTNPIVSKTTGGSAEEY